MKIRFGTESGSTYLLDEEARTWTRESHNPSSNQVRTRDGEMFWHSPVETGKGVHLVGPGLEFGARYIVTTPVVWHIEVVDPC